MFVVHTLIDGKNTTRDFGHVNMFFRENPLFRQAKDEEIFKQCVEQGFIYISEYLCDTVNGRRAMITYHKKLDLLLDEVAYNKTTYNGRRIK
ncbi:hypothetical protein HWC54_gp217 [Klebsiella phage Marfa]|uniref:Uncharacterized protein n=1 Tax=Klebsiella phage Marfa TaxID=2587809 RepID=A0A4Y5TR46_9CAUD|nr:hypothetical protein HWC54_gp217 [Klebsiella phage Marfa]QDB71855.1 hypothetical protein CPT_Marfa_210 [Klebsiella phage Marfa]